MGNTTQGCTVGQTIEYSSYNKFLITYRYNKVNITLELLLYMYRMYVELYIFKTVILQFIYYSLFYTYKNIN